MDMAIGSVEWMKMPIGDRLKVLRDARDWTQMDLAAAAGIQLGIVSKIEGGTTKDPRWSTVCALADALGVPVTALRDPPAELQETSKKGGPHSKKLIE